MKVKAISLPYIFQVMYVLCFTRPRYQVSVYRTIGPLVHSWDHLYLNKRYYLELTLGYGVQCPRVWARGQNLEHLYSCNLVIPSVYLKNSSFCGDFKGKSLPSLNDYWGKHCALITGMDKLSQAKWDNSDPTLPHPTLLPYPILPYPTLPYPTLPYPIIPFPYPTPYPTPYLTLPYPTPYYTLPPTIPYSTLPFPTPL